jgi:hypothetical protein
MTEIEKEINDLEEQMSLENYFIKYERCGFVENVSLVIIENQMDITIQLWCSEDDPRRWIESENSYESLKVFLKRKLTQASQSIGQFFNEIKN